MESYSLIMKYTVRCKLKEPLHVGTTDGGPDEVLVHPVTGQPFVQASSLAGAMRDYCRRTYSAEEADKLFGSSSDEDRIGSRIRIADGEIIADKDGIRMEYRPRVRIDGHSGAVSSGTVLGTDRESGHKFEMLLVSAGQKFEFSAYVYTDAKNRKYIRQVMLDILSAFQNEEIQIGGQKSNGCGYLDIVDVWLYEFDMSQKDGRKNWLREDKLPRKSGKNLKGDLNRSQSADYVVHMRGKTEGELLVKGIALDVFGENVPDSINIQNGAKDYIIPGSALKGVLRSQMERICGFRFAERKDELIKNAFGAARGLEDDRGRIGDLYFCDTVIGTQKSNDAMPLRHRIHIDKLTGGVIHGGKFSERNVAGEFDVRIMVRSHNNAKQSMGLLLFALRDLAVGTMSVGGGSNVGKGFLDVDEITVDHQGEQSTIHIRNQKIDDKSGLIRDCLDSLRRER